MAMNRAKTSVRLPPEVNRVLYVRNLPYKNTCMANSINVSKMIKHDFLVIPKQGLIGKPLTSRLGDHP